MEDKAKPLVYAYCDRWQNGGVEAYLMNVFRGWDFSAMQVMLVTAEKTTAQYDEELEQLGVQHIVLLDELYASPIKRILHTLRRFRTFISRQPCDAVYLNLSNSFTMAYAVLAKWAGVPVRVVHSHCSGLQAGGARRLKLLGAWLGRQLFLPAVTDFWACSDFAAEWIFGKRHTQKPVEILPNGVSLDKFRFSPQQRADARRGLGLEQELLLGTVGRLTELKHQGFLLDILADLQKSGQKAKLLLVGDGELYNALKHKAESLGIAQDVIFYGTTPQVPRLLCAMDLFLLPSEFEGSPVSVIEAQAVGLHCLVSDQVTRQCNVLGSVLFLPIHQGTKSWCDAILLERAAPHSDMTALMHKAGYDVKDMGPRVQRLLQRKLREVKQ
jgi:glycosyltransferase involved in cell wall biosynthesis